MAAGRRGLVMEVDARSLVVLTSDGAFLRVPRSQVAGPVAVGEEIALPGGAARPAWRRRATAAAAVAAVALLAVAAGLFWSAPQAAYAHVSVDIAPGVTADLTLDAQGRVVGASGTPAAQELLRKADVRGRDVEEAVRRLLQPAVDSGGPVAVVVAVDAQAPVLPPGLARKLEAAKAAVEEGARRKGRPVAVIGLEDERRVSDALRAEARAHGLSLGEYLLYLEAKKEGAALDLGSVKEKGVWEALRAAGLSPEQVAERVETGVLRNGSGGTAAPGQGGANAGEGAGPGPGKERGNGRGKGSGTENAGHAGGGGTVPGGGMEPGGGPSQPQGHGHEKGGSGRGDGQDKGPGDSAGQVTPPEAAGPSEGASDHGEKGSGRSGGEERGGHHGSFWQRVGDALRQAVPWGGRASEEQGGD
ncbi:MAG: anti-sigma factor domain-containing protein [Firmicutes bacterium]|nr:anti-sigma factor domain-containing protein [Bacillota bacterium]